jgi:hypothetical protein
MFVAHSLNKKMILLYFVTHYIEQKAFQTKTAEFNNFYNLHNI